MKKFKKIFLAIVTLALSLALASCDKEEARNEIVPYGNLNLEAEIATANDGAYKLNTKTYYNKLRTKSYDLFVREIKNHLLDAEINAIAKLLTNKDSLTAEEKTVLSFTGDAADLDVDYLQNKYHRLLGNTFATLIYGTYSLDTYNNKTAEALELSVAKYIQTQANRGYTVKAEDIVASFDTVLNTVSVDYTKLPQELVKEQIFSQAQNLYGEKQLYKIAGEEKIDSEDEDGNPIKIKNTNYLFNDANFQTYYEKSYMNFGEYQTIIIQFNSYKDAKDAISEVTASINNPEAFYLELYNTHYSYRKNVTSVEDDVFTYEVTEEIDELSEISSGVYTLVTETLKDGEYLVEPRNINNKYVMAYRIDTNYTIGGAEKVEYEDLTEAQNAEIKPELERLIIEAKGATYATTAMNDLFEASDIKIFDPYFEYKFNYSYSTQYDLITKEEFPTETSANLFTIGDFKYSVADFYELASKTFGQSVITEHFSLEFATQFIDKYVTEETVKTNTEALDAAIKSFENNENTTYPAEIGLNTFLFANYGYTNKEEIIKYYYSASSALSKYKADIVNESWIEKNPENETVNVMSSSATKVVETLLASGTKYSELFAINIDHILINFDDNGDGNPDNPETFLTKNPEAKEAFEKAVAKLAQEIYKEATYLVEKGNTTFESFQYIVKQYNKGSKLNYDATKDWDDYKEFNFLLTAEQLASNSDITQDSVSNFVVPFADYVKALYAGLSENKVEVDEDNGSIVIVTDVKANEAKLVEKADEITFDALCGTNYGYHLLVVNEYEGPESLKDTSTKYNTHFIKISEGDDEESEDDDIYVTVSTINEKESEATKEQLYVYLVQKNLSITSTLDDDVVSVLADLYDEAIATYTSGNFQTLVLIDTLGITSSNQNITNMINTERAYYVNLVTNYDAESPYASWCAKAVTTTTFKK